MAKPKQIAYGEYARDALVRGFDTLAEAVRPTLGPKGRPVILDNKLKPPAVIDAEQALPEKLSDLRTLLRTWELNS